MRRRKKKTLAPVNEALRSAMAATGRGQRALAVLARMHESRLSSIVHGRFVPHESERLRLSGVLQRPVGELFPDAEGTP